MFGEFAPTVKGIKLSDSTLTLSQGRRALAVNQAASFTWTGSHIWTGSGSLTIQNASVNCTTSWTQQAQFSMYSNFYLPYWTYGSIPFISGSNFLTYDAADFYHDPFNKRVGIGIGYLSSLPAKLNVVGLYNCEGSATACSSIMNMGDCNSQNGCYWYNNNYCYSYYDQSGCNSQPGCNWFTGYNCDTYNNNQSGCESYPGECSWSGNYSNCSGLSDESSCNYAGGSYQQYCQWYSNTCSGYYDQTTCNNNTPCYWAGSNCNDYNDNYSGCIGASGCTWTAGGVDCSSYDNTDQATCEYYFGCTWNSGTSECQGGCNGIYNGSCQGDNSYCSGSTYPDGTGTCSGYYDAECQEAPLCLGTATSCSDLTDDGQSMCEAQDGCSWAKEPAAYIDGRMYIAGYPTSSAGQPTGAVWVDAGAGYALKVVP